MFMMKVLVLRDVVSIACINAHRGLTATKSLIWVSLYNVWNGTIWSGLVWCGVVWYSNVLQINRELIMVHCGIQSGVSGIE